MSVLVIGKLQGDTATFRQAVAAFIGSIGAAPAPPEMIVAEAVASADQY